MSRRAAPGFLDTQNRHFEAADEEHFHWATGAPGFAETEDALLEPILAELRSPCLEVGCGEGGNLVRLARGATCYAVDLHPARVAFAASQVPGLRCAAADAAALPFADGSFPTVFLRDLLHHVPDPPPSPAGPVSRYTSNSSVPPANAFTSTAVEASNPLTVGLELYVNSATVPWSGSGSTTSVKTEPPQQSHSDHGASAESI